MRNVIIALMMLTAILAIGGLQRHWQIVELQAKVAKLGADMNKTIR